MRQITIKSYLTQTFALNFVSLHQTSQLIVKVTIKDIAREMNTASSTVSRALNNKSGISERKRQEILLKAKEMGYEPNLLARQLQSGGSNTIGLIVPRINRVFFSNVIHGVETEAKAKGYSVIICQSNESLEEETECIRTLLSNSLAGILMSHSKKTEKPGYHQEILERKIPFVMFDRVFPDMQINKVFNDNFNGAYIVTKHLIDQGYQKIVHYTGPLTTNIYRERTEGFKKAMMDNGLPVLRNSIREFVITKESGFNETNKLIRSKQPFDAIFAASDFSALGAILCLQESNIKVPDQVGIAGYANEPFTELMHITTIDQHSTELGRSAARLLFQEIEDDGVTQANKDVIIKTELIVRESTNKSKVL